MVGIWSVSNIFQISILKKFNRYKGRLKLTLFPFSCAFSAFNPSISACAKKKLLLLVGQFKDILLRIESRNVFKKQYIFRQPENL